MNTTPDKARPLRIAYAGTPEFAAVSLARLLQSSHSVIAVYCQPDRPTGRGRKMQFGPVKTLAIDSGIPVLQPASLREAAAQESLRNLAPDLMVVAAYGLLLPRAVLNIPSFGCINVHASLLPRWRGAAPIQHAILAGDTNSGVTIMQMEEGLDTGDLLHQQSCEISDVETGSELHDRLALLGAEALSTVLLDLPHYQANATSQNAELATYAHKIKKADAQINWLDSAISIHRQVRAFNAWPVCYSSLLDTRIRIWEAYPDTYFGSAAPGTIVKSSSEGIEVACGEGLLRLIQIQLAGGKRLAAAQILNAYQRLFKPGNLFVN